MQNGLQGKVAIVTGASSGIGWVTAKVFAARGAKVVVAARRKERLDALVDEIGAASAVAVVGDVAHEDVAARLVSTAVERFGGLDVAFNNAGAAGAGCAVPEMALEAWRQVLDDNLTSAFLCAKYQIPALVKRGGGAVIFNSSFVGNTTGFPGMAAYSAAKAGVVGLVRTLAVELAVKGIRVNAILPGGIDTPANAGNLQPEMRGFIEGLHAVKRLGRPEEIAEAAVFLAGDGCPFLTGTAMLVDGGVSINRT